MKSSKSKFWTQMTDFLSGNLEANLLVNSFKVAVNGWFQFDHTSLVKGVLGDFGLVFESPNLLNR